MNGQIPSLLAHRLKKLMASAADGVDVGDTVRSLLEADRNLRAERFDSLMEQPLRLLRSVAES